MNGDLRTPLARARGLGSAKSGVTHWWAQRLTAIALITFPPSARVGRIIAWSGDLFPWQIATVFYSKKFAADRVRAVNFMKGYVKSSRHYYDAVLSGAQGAAYDEVVAVTARYTAAPEAVIKLGLPYQDRSGRLWVEDIARQMTWWQRHGFIKATIPLKDVVDTSFVEAAVKAIGD